MAGYPMSVCARIKKRRDELQMERWELGKAVGVSDETIARLERGEHRTHKRTFFKILKRLGLPDDLLETSAVPETPPPSSDAPPASDPLLSCGVPPRDQGGTVVSDPFAGLRWEWEQLAVEQRREAVHAMQDALRLFTRGEVRRGHHLAKTKAQ